MSTSTTFDPRPLIDTINRMRMVAVQHEGSNCTPGRATLCIRD